MSKLNQELYDQMWDIFRFLGAEALTMSHYDLAQETEITDATLWREFLLVPEVSDWVKTEITLIQESELKKMIKDVNKSRSVGQAQLMNTLSKMNETKTVKEGPVFIYTYVPLSPEQIQAPNVRILNEDVFLVKEVQP